MSHVTSGSGDESWDDLVKRACDGNDAAWQALCERLKNVAWKTINRFRMPMEDRKDVFAVTFLRLYTHIRTIEQPDRLPGWVATTASNEAKQLLRRQGKYELVETFDEYPSFDDDGVEEHLSDRDRQRVREGVRQLGEKCQKLLRLVSIGASMKTIAAETGMPHGSIGPTRRRCLDNLRDLIEAAS